MHALLVISDGEFPDEAARKVLLAGGVEVREAARDGAPGAPLPAEPAGPPAAVLVALRAPLDETLRRCRELEVEAPVIAAVDRAEVAAMPPGRGADDVIVRPIDPAELLARVRFLLWRTRRAGPDENIVRAGDLAIDTARYEVTVGGRRVDLTLKEYELLLFLARHRGRVFTRNQLLDRIWGQQYFGGTRTVDVHVRRLRMKIERGGRVYVDTVRGVGYRFVG